MDHIDQFFNRLTLVNFVGGSMGTFLCDLVADCDHPYYVRHKGGSITMNDNYEWCTTDYFHHLFSDRYDPQSFKRFIDKFGPGWEKYYLYAYALEEMNYLNHRLLSPPGLVDKIEDLDSYMKKTVDDFEIAFRTVKTHPDQKISIHKSIKWKYKIFSYFPEEKQWVQKFLFLWKRHFSVIDGAKPNPMIGIDEFQFKTLIRSLEVPGWLHVVPRAESKIDKTEFKGINMYQLVFQKNIDTVMSAMPDFQMTNEKMKLLETAHSTSLKIFDKLELDHTAILRPDITVKELIANSRVPYYINEFSKKYNIYP